MAKKEEPDADWDRLSSGRGCICGGDGYSLTGRRKIPWPGAFHRDFEWISYKFTKRQLPQGERSDG